MTTAQATTEEQATAAEKILVLKRVLPATPDRVFDAWTRPELMRRWMSPGPMTTEVAESDTRVGGAYRIVMVDPESGSYSPSGVYEEVVPNEKLVYTWKWEHEEGVSRVTVELRPTGDGSTELTLTHEGFSTRALRDDHEEGWVGCFEKLTALFATPAA